MNAMYRLIALAIIWICAGGVLVVLFESNFLNRMAESVLVTLTVIIMGGAVAATYFLSRVERS